MQSFFAELLAQIPAAFELLLYAYGIFVVTWPVFLLLEKLAPVNAHTPRSNYVFNWKIVATNFLLTPLFYALAIAISVSVSRSLGLPLLPYPEHAWAAEIPVLGVALRSLVLFATACFLGDFWYYWWHRAQHEFPALWELHKLHHSDEHMNATTIYRSHFFELAGQALVRGLSVGLLVDLRAEPGALVVALAAGLLPPIWDFFIHANVRLPALGALVPFLSTPQFHRIHHSKLPEHQDKNYAIWLPLFDVVFGSYHRPQPDEYPPTGLSSGERIETLWEAQAGPFLAWARSLRGQRSPVAPD